MKKILFSILIITAVGFSVKTDNSDKAAATVNQAQGLYLFTDSKPANQYDFLGTVKYNNVLSNPQYNNVRDQLIKRIKKEWPAADGVIFHFNSGGADHADAIKFK